MYRYCYILLFLFASSLSAQPKLVLNKFYTPNGKLLIDTSYQLQNYNPNKPIFKDEEAILLNILNQLVYPQFQKEQGISDEIIIELHFNKDTLTKLDFQKGRSENSYWAFCRANEKIKIPKLILLQKKIPKVYIPVKFVIQGHEDIKQIGLTALEVKQFNALDKCKHQLRDTSKYKPLTADDITLLTKAYNMYAGKNLYHKPSDIKNYLKCLNRKNEFVIVDTSKLSNDSEGGGCMRYKLDYYYPKKIMTLKTSPYEIDFDGFDKIYPTATGFTRIIGGCSGSVGGLYCPLHIWKDST